MGLSYSHPRYNVEVKAGAHIVVYQLTESGLMVLFAQPSPENAQLHSPHFVMIIGRDKLSSSNFYHGHSVRPTRHRQGISFCTCL